MTPLNGQQMNALLHYIEGGLQMLKTRINRGSKQTYKARNPMSFRKCEPSKSMVLSKA